jgi:hypothetical protein
VDTYLHSLFDQLKYAANESRLTRDKWILIDKIYEKIDDLSIFPFQDVLQKILSLIEEYPDLDYGGPGPFGTFIEGHAFVDYTPALMESLTRQPSIQVIGWLNRSVLDGNFQNGSGNNPVTPKEFALQLYALLKHPLASQECKEFAEICFANLKSRGHIDA